VRGLTPREPVWGEGEFVDQPIHRGGAIPHWSRWEKSTTTFGPVGRVAITTVAVLWVGSAAARSPITLVFVLPLVVVIIRSVWQRGWVVPAHLVPEHPMRPAEPTPRVPVDRSEVLRGVALTVLGLTGGAILLYERDPIPRFVVIVTAIVAVAVWAWRKIGER
jgi:hypothetical protein